MPIPAHTSWPQPDDLYPTYTALGLSDANLTALETCLWTAVKSAVQWFEEETGYVPFLGETQTRTFDAPGSHSGFYAARTGGERILRLDGGLLSLTSLNVNGTAKIVGTDFWLRPNNAASKGKPYEWIEFAAPIYGQGPCISIVGVWGRSTEIPAGAWDAVIKKAFVLAAPDVINLQDKNMISWTDGDTSENYGTTAMQQQISIAGREASRLAEQFRRVAVGL